MSRSPWRAAVPPTTRSATLLAALLAIGPRPSPAQPPPVQIVSFTHIEDNTPVGTLGTPQCRQNYLFWRSKLIGVAHLMQDRGVPWSLQPDWKILRAALLYEDAALMQTTNGKNFLRFLKEDLGAVVDPHSHENGGYNYTDVAHLLDSLGVGATRVIGGHIWDPDSPLFQEWDRFRVPVQGERYSWAWWRGDILMGSGTPNHVNDPVVSGVWRPQDRHHYFTHDSAANIAAVGQFRGTIECVEELAGLYQSGTVPEECLLTASYHIKPATISRADGLRAIEDSVITPILAYESSGLARATDFTSLVQSWQAEFGSRGCIYDAGSTAEVGTHGGMEGGAGGGRGHDPSARPLGSVLRLDVCAPNPFASRTRIQFTVQRRGWIRLDVYDVLGQRVATLAEGERSAGIYSILWDASGMAGGAYLLWLRGAPGGDGARTVADGWKALLVR